MEENQHPDRPESYCPLCRRPSTFKKVKAGRVDGYEIRCGACNAYRVSGPLLAYWTSGRAGDDDTALMKALHNKLKGRSASETDSVPGLMTTKNWQAIAGSGVSE